MVGTPGKIGKVDTVQPVGERKRYASQEKSDAPHSTNSAASPRLLVI